MEEVDQLARMPHSLVGSVKKRYNIAEPLEDDPLKVRSFLITSPWAYVSIYILLMLTLLFFVCRQ